MELTVIGVDQMSGYALGFGKAAPRMTLSPSSCWHAVTVRLVVRVAAWRYEPLSVSIGRISLKMPSFRASEYPSRKTARYDPYPTHDYEVFRRATGLARDGVPCPLFAAM